MRIVMVMQKKLTISEAAKYIGASTSSLRRWEKLGYLTPERTHGGDRRYTETQLDQFIEASRKRYAS